MLHLLFQRFHFQVLEYAKLYVGKACNHRRRAPRGRLMVSANKGTKIVLTASEIEMSHFGDDPFGAFAGSFLLIPSFLKPLYMPKEHDLANNRARIAPYGLRKTEALLLNNGFDESDLAVIHPKNLNQFIGPDTRMVKTGNSKQHGDEFIQLLKEAAKDLLVERSQYSANP